MRFEHLTTVSEIDRAIDHNRRALRSLETINVMSAASWQAAWDKHPGLRARERALFICRHDAQLIVWAREARDAAQQERAEKRTARARSRKEYQKSKCPTCGSHTLAVAA